TSSRASNRRVGILPMRNDSRPGKAPHDESANACIFNIHHIAPSHERPPLAERKCGKLSLAVMFCDLVESTHLSSQLDPEDYRDVVRAYQQVCADVITRFEGHIAQLLGDGLLVYFGYPHAHDDDAQRAVRTGLGILAAMQALDQGLPQAKGLQLAVRL